MASTNNGVAFDLLKKPKRNKYAFACAILASMTSILLGYDGGVMSGAGLFIKDDLKLSNVELEILMGIINIFSLAGSAVAGRTSDWIGRRYTIVVASVNFFVGAILMGLAPNYTVLMIGRFVAGIGTGYALMIAPVYTAEVAPALSRGFLTSFPEVFINIGVLLGYVSNYAFARLPDNLGWRLMLGVGAIPSIFLALGVLFMPESPRWLVLQGRLGDAKKVLDRISESKEDAMLRLEDIKQACGIPEHCTDDVVPVSKQSHGQGVWKELLFSPSPTVRHILIAGVGIHFFQMASGTDTVVLYSPKIFEKAGIKSKSNKLLATVAVGFSKTVFILISTFFVDRFGRRVLLLSSVGGMIVSLGTLATCLTVIDHSEKRLPGVLALAVFSVLSMVATFSMGLGPIAWVYSSEVFPIRLRAQGMGLGVAMNRVISGLVTMTFITLYEAITIGGAFYLYMGVAIISWLFFYTLLPETRGRTLEEMQELFGTFFRWRSRARELEKNKQIMSEADGQFQQRATPKEMSGSGDRIVLN